MKRMEHAHYAVLPDWTSDNYVDLYAQAFNSSACLSSSPDSPFFQPR